MHLIFSPLASSSVGRTRRWVSRLAVKQFRKRFPIRVLGPIPIRQNTKSVTKDMVSLSSILTRSFRINLSYRSNCDFGSPCNCFECTETAKRPVCDICDVHPPYCAPVFPTVSGSQRSHILQIHFFLRTVLGEAYGRKQKEGTGEGTDGSISMISCLKIDAVRSSRPFDTDFLAFT
jgi:hypothetical protein